MWKEIVFNASSIVVETKKALLIELPKKSRYRGWKVWHPISMVTGFYDDVGYWLKLIYPEKWNFEIVKDNERKKISHEELEVAFTFIEDDYDYWASSYYRTTEPVKINVDYVGVDESLKR